MKRQFLLLLAIVLFGVVCTSAAAAGDAKLGRLFDDYWQAYLADNPGFAAYIGDNRYDNKLFDLSEAAYKRRYATARAFLKRADAINEARLSESEKLSLKMLKRQLHLAIDGEPLYAYLADCYLMPINQMEGIHVKLLNSPDTHAFKTAEDYRRYIQMISGFPVQVDAAIANMRKGIKLGIVLPREVVERVLPELETAIVTDAAKSPIHGPTTRFPDAVSAAQRAEIMSAMDSVILEKIIPAYKQLLDFMKNEYLSKARPTIAYSELPNGRAMYAYFLKVHTATDLSADELHQIGLKELDSASAERQKILDSVGFKGTAVEFGQKMQADKTLRFYTAQDVEKELRDDLAFIRPKLETVFRDVPRFDFEIKPVEPFREASFPSGQFFAATADGVRPGIFYYNSYNVATEGIRKFTLPGLAYHEAFPGHGFEDVYTRLNKNLPAFRVYGTNSAYNEGWAVYTEDLADELGGYRDAYSRSAWLNAHTFSAVSLVVETGIHTKGWTREQAFAFVRKYLPMPETRFNVFMARWAALPGQALSGGVGSIKIMQLREKAKRELGAKFDIRDFHDTVLRPGNLPLGILEEIVNAWIARTKLK